MWLTCGTALAKEKERKKKGKDLLYYSAFGGAQERTVSK